MRAPNRCKRNALYSSESGIRKNDWLSDARMRFDCAPIPLRWKQDEGKRTVVAPARCVPETAPCQRQRSFLHSLGCGSPKRGPRQDCAGMHGRGGMSYARYSSASSVFVRSDKHSSTFLVTFSVLVRISYKSAHL